MAPDGDAMGSALAMWHYCQKRATVIVPNAFPAFLGWMPGAEEIRIYEQKPQECDKLIAEADMIICTDFNDPKRIGPMGEKMVANSCPKVLIDHHLMDRCADRAQTANADRPASPDGLWTEVHSHPEASSACEIVYRLIKTAGADRIQTANADRPLTLTEEIATCIYTGLMTDTGNFSYNSNNPEIYEIVASLLRAGARKDDIYDRVFNQYSTDRMRLTGYALYRKMRIGLRFVPQDAHLPGVPLGAHHFDRLRAGAIPLQAGRLRRIGEHAAANRRCLLLRLHARRAPETRHSQTADTHFLPFARRPTREYLGKRSLPRRRTHERLRRRTLRKPRTSSKIIRKYL